MGQSGKVKGSMDSPYEMEARESEEDEERDNRTCWNKSNMVDNLNTAELMLTKLSCRIFLSFSKLCFTSTGVSQFLAI